MDWQVAKPEDMETLGVRLASCFEPRLESAVIVYLRGDLGAGKTTLARGILRGLGVTDAVRSPTYALVEPYDADAVTVLHLDLYRLRDPAELEPLGLRDWTGPKHLWLVEWPEKANGLPSADVSVTLRVREGVHLVSATGVSAFGQAWLERANTA